MRIVAWNCCRGPFEKKLAALGTLSPDVAVIPEALQPDQESAQVLWFPSNASRLGIQVRTYGTYRLKRLPAADLPNCVVPVRVSGPAAFNLLAVWTWPAPSYIKAFLNGLEAYSELLNSGATVVAGDFNGNPVFDKPGHRLKWSDGFSKSQDSGLVSAHHHVHQARYGAERDATHQFLRKTERPFHIDFCFVPLRWTRGPLQAQVVHGADWRLLSDHFPLLVSTEGSPRKAPLHVHPTTVAGP
jgi:hypothetical protein